jgi:hypothetical protein
MRRSSHHVKGQTVGEEGMNRTEERGMKTRVPNRISQTLLAWARLIPVFVAVLLIAFTAGAASAQTDGGAAQARESNQIRNAAQNPQGDALRQRIRERIENDAALEQQDRDRLRRHLGECQELGLDDETVAMLFDESKPLQKQIRMQERILTLAREGLPHEPVVQKLREGRQKGADDGAIERVCERMEEDVRAANRVMVRAREDGLGRGDADAERARTRDMAMNMWRGVSEDECDQLRERARLRLRDGSCTTEELVVSAETAVKLRDMGIERGRALEVAGEALQNGYTTREMRQMGWMVMTAASHGGPRDDVLDTIERGIRDRNQLTEMSQEMWQRGWMGPADEHGGHHGGNMMNDAPGGSPGGHQGDNTKGQGDRQGGGGQGGNGARGGEHGANS